MIGSGAAAKGISAAKKIGLDGRQATDSLRKIESSYNEIMSQMVDFMQSGVIGALSDVWYGNDAVKFMREKFQPAIDSVVDSTERVFTSVNETVNQAATNYDNQHQTNVFQKVSHVVKNGKVKTDGFKSDNNGFVGITNSSSFEAARKALTQISANVDAKLKEAKEAAANSGFHGGEQQQRLVESMEKIKESLAGLTNELNEAAKEALTKAVEREEELAKANADSFTA